MKEQINSKRNGPWRQTERDVLDAIRLLGSASSRNIGELIGLSHKWVEDKIRFLRENGRIFISDWRKIHLHGPARQFYSIRDADQEDEPKPEPISDVEKSRNYKRRKEQLRRMLHESRGNEPTRSDNSGFS